MKKEIPKKGYRTLSLVWTLAAASMAVAVVRRLPELNVPLLVLLLFSVLIAYNFRQAYRRAPDETVPVPPSRSYDWDDEEDDFYVAPPPPIGSQLFTDDTPARPYGQNQDSEENDHE